MTSCCATETSNIANRTSRHQRPAEADGHAILILTERSTNFILMERRPHGRKALPVAQTVARLLFPYRKSLKTIITDNICEFAAHLERTRLLSMKNKEMVTVYCADSYSFWQKGARENANKILREYFPKGSDFKNITQEQFNQAQYEINMRPRKKLGYSTPKKEFCKRIA